MKKVVKQMYSRLILVYFRIEIRCSGLLIKRKKKLQFLNYITHNLKLRIVSFVSLKVFFGRKL